MIYRQIQNKLLDDAKKAPVLALLGPRQSGKTTTVKIVFDKHAYVSLENPDQREFAVTDPRRFLREVPNEFGLIIDEVQHAPKLLSYLQQIVDEDYRPGYFIITGSHNILMMEAISQSLAGRISLHTLLPLSIEELSFANLLPTDPMEAVFKGFYPVIYGRDRQPADWYVDYIQTYIERDVRLVSNISNLSLFRKFIQLCAGRVGQLINVTSLANECGIGFSTARSWLSILEAGYIIFFVQPHFKNFNKRLTKTPKLYFFDTGLACSLLGIRDMKQADTHYLRGGLFESMIMSDLYKGYYNRDERPQLYFWQDKSGHEIDCIIEKGSELFPVEIKSGETINSDFFKNLTYWNELSKGSSENGYVVYGGQENQKRTLGLILSWNDATKKLLQ